MTDLLSLRQDAKSYLGIDDRKNYGIVDGLMVNAGYPELIEPHNELEESLANGQLTNGVLPTVLTNQYFQATSGSTGSPGYSWAAETNSGFYRIGSNNFGVSVGNSLKWDWNATRILYATTYALHFRDSALTIQSPSDGQLDIDADIKLRLDAPTIEPTGDILFAVDNTEDIGAASANRARTGYFGTKVQTPIVVGGPNASDTLTLRATDSATDGNILFQTDPTTERGRFLSTGEFLVGATTVIASESVLFRKDQNLPTKIIAHNLTDGTSASTQFLVTQGDGATKVEINIIGFSPSHTQVNQQIPGEAQLTAGGGGLTALNIRLGSNLPIKFSTSDAERARIRGTGEVLINAAAPSGSETFRHNGRGLMDDQLITTSNTTRAAVRVGSFAGDPSSLSNGDVWYNSTQEDFRCRENGTTRDLRSSVKSGATVPTSPDDGDLFLHTPTGRSILLLRRSGSWHPIRSFGSTTLYVDPTGTDSIDKGGATGTDAFLTIQFAINQIPGQVGGDVTINLATGTYREQVTIQGKEYTGNFSITISGATTTDTTSTATSGANPVGNGSAGWGTITDSGAAWTVNAWRNKLVFLVSGTGAGQLYVIDSNTATTITIVGRWATVPDSTTFFGVITQSSRITGADAGADTTPVRARCFDITGGQKKILLTTLRMNYSVNEIIQLSSSSQCDITLSLLEGNGATASTYCVLLLQTSTGVISHNAFVGADQGVALSTNSQAVFLYRNRYQSPGVYGIHAVTGGVFTAWESGISSAGTYGIFVEGASGCETDAYLDIDSSGNDNIRVSGNSTLTATAIQGAISTQRLRNSVAGWGINCPDGGVGLAVSTITYSGNSLGTRNPAAAATGGTS